MEICWIGHPGNKDVDLAQSKDAFQAAQDNVFDAHGLRLVDSERVRGNHRELVKHGLASCHEGFGARRDIYEVHLGQHHLLICSTFLDESCHQPQPGGRYRLLRFDLARFPVDESSLGAVGEPVFHGNIRIEHRSHTMAHAGYQCTAVSQVVTCVVMARQLQQP